MRKFMIVAAVTVGLLAPTAAQAGHSFSGARASVYCINVGSLLFPTECFSVPR